MEHTKRWGAVFSSKKGINNNHESSPYDTHYMSSFPNNSFVWGTGWNFSHRAILIWTSKIKNGSCVLQPYVNEIWELWQRGRFSVNDLHFSQFFTQSFYMTQNIESYDTLLWGYLVLDSCDHHEILLYEKRKILQKLFWKNNIIQLLNNMTENNDRIFIFDEDMISIKYLNENSCPWFYVVPILYKQ